MTRRRGLTWTALSLVTLAMAAQVTGTGCASDTNNGYSSSGPGRQMPPPGPSVYEVITALELEPAQLPAVRAVLEDAEDEREVIFTTSQSGMGERPDPSTMNAVRAKMTDLNERTEKRMGELLTTEQMAEYREMIRKAEQQRDEMRSQMGGRRGSGGGKRGSGGGSPGAGGW